MTCVFASEHGAPGQLSYKREVAGSTPAAPTTASACGYHRYLHTHEEHANGLAAGARSVSSLNVREDGEYQAERDALDEYHTVRAGSMCSVVVRTPRGTSASVSE